MKLFYVVGGFKPALMCTYPGKHVHADTPHEARDLAYMGYDMMPLVYVYDVSQTALCAGVLDLDKVPRVDFVIA